jgi:hypothetical protein
MTKFSFSDPKKEVPTPKGKRKIKKMLKGMFNKPGIKRIESGEFSEWFNVVGGFMIEYYHSWLLREKYSPPKE